MKRGTAGLLFREFSVVDTAHCTGPIAQRKQQQSTLQVQQLKPDAQGMGRIGVEFSFVTGSGSLAAASPDLLDIAFTRFPNPLPPGRIVV